MEKNLKNNRYVCITETLCCTLETNTTYTSINQNYKKKKTLKKSTFTCGLICVLIQKNYKINTFIAFMR